MAKINNIISASNATLVRDKIAEILTLEVDNQFVLSGEEVFDCEHYIERFTRYSDDEKKSVINVFYTQSGNVRHYGNKRVYTSEYHIECNLKQKEDDVDPGDNILGDTVASDKLQRLLFVVEAILMSTEYIALDLPDIVKSKRITLITSSPTEDGLETGNEVAGRVVIEVEHEEVGNITDGVQVVGVDSLFKKVPTEFGIKIVKN